MFVQQELGERRENWITGLQEYALKYKLVHAIKGLHLRWLVAEVVDAKE